MRLEGNNVTGTPAGVWLGSSGHCLLLPSSIHWQFCIRVDTLLFIHFLLPQCPNAQVHSRSHTQNCNGSAGTHFARICLGYTRPQETTILGGLRSSRSCLGPSLRHKPTSYSSIFVCSPSGEEKLQGLCPSSL